jgi:hypothetical protein
MKSDYFKGSDGKIYSGKALAEKKCVKEPDEPVQ